MESSDQYNFSIFHPRNLHGRKNRNVILSMIAIWAVAVFGFQFLLRVIEKPTPEQPLVLFESVWPKVSAGNGSETDVRNLLHALIPVMGKTTVKPDDQKLLRNAITLSAFSLVPDSLRNALILETGFVNSMRERLPLSIGDEYTTLKSGIKASYEGMAIEMEPYTLIGSKSLEGIILSHSISEIFPESLSHQSFERLPDVMKLYLIHNRSVLTDTRFLGFPFHYFYTAVFLLILFIVLCIVYNVLIEWRLKKEGVVE